MDMKSSSPKDIKQGALFLWLWREYLRRHMWVLAIIVVLMMIEGSMVGGLAWMMQPLFDGVFVGGSKSQLWLVGGIVLGLFLIRGVLSVVHRAVLQPPHLLLHIPAQAGSPCLGKGAFVRTKTVFQFLSKCRNV